MTKRIFVATVMFLAVLFVGAVASVQVQASSFTLNFDENGNGSISQNGGAFTPLRGSLMPDPSNGGVLALTYFLPSLQTNGDVVVRESNTLDSDAVRFTDANGNLTGSTADRLIYYSDLSDGHLDVADTGFPTNLNRSITIAEVGPEGNNGFSFGSPNVYNGISDTPEPSSIVLLGTGLLGIGGYIRRKWLP